MGIKFNSLFCIAYISKFYFDFPFLPLVPGNTSERIEYFLAFPRPNKIISRIPIHKVPDPSKLQECFQWLAQCLKSPFKFAMFEGKLKGVQNIITRQQRKNKGPEKK